MADNAIIKILTALLKHQVKKVVRDEALGAIGQEIASIGGDKVDEQIKSWLGEETKAEELENAARHAQKCFQDKVEEYELVQWMVSLPLGNLPTVVEAIEKLPKSPDEKELENALRESVSKNWKKISPEQVDNAIISFLSCLRSAILPIQKQTLMVIGRSVLRTEDKVDLLIRWFERYIIRGKIIAVKEIDSDPDEFWNLKHSFSMPPNFTGREAERKYKDRLKELYSTMRVIFKAETLPLNDLYVDLFVLEEPEAFRRYGIDYLESGFEDTSGFFSRGERSSARHVVSQKENLFVLGKPGAGKTTLLKYLTTLACEEKINKVPIFISFNNWAMSQKELIEFIVEQFDICGFPDAKSFIDV